MNRARKIARKYETTCRPTRPVWVAPPTDFSTFGRTELRRTCKDRGIAYSQMTKAQMVEALAADEAVRRQVRAAA